MSIPLPPINANLDAKSGDVWDLKSLASNFARRGHVFNYRSQGATGGEGVAGSAGGEAGSLSTSAGAIPWALIIGGIVVIKLLKGQK